MKNTTQNKTRVVVIGGGYAGVLAANRLRQRPEFEIALINPRPRFVERIRLHQLVAGSNDATEGYDDLLGAGIRLVVDARRPVSTHPPGRSSWHPERNLAYDYLIYAVGSTGNVPAEVRGAAEFAYPLSELEQAERLRTHLQDVPLSAPVIVVGGGLTGIEAASEFAQAGRQVTLVGDQVGPSLAGIRAQIGDQGVAQTRRHHRRRGQGHGAHRRRRHPLRWSRAVQCGDGVDGRFRCAGPGRGQRAEHRRTGTAAHRRVPDQRERLRTSSPPATPHRRRVCRCG